jgi:magnesium transporter
MNNKKFPNESAGRKMIEQVPLCYLDNTILDVRKILFQKMKELETINYIYVVNKNKKLVGVFSIKEIFRCSERTSIKEIAEREVVKVRPYTDQERVAILALENNLKSIPVVDKNDKFLGVVPSDIILDILYSENLEDFLKMAGIKSPLQKILKGSALYLFKIRIPWLVLGLLGGIVGATIISFFEGPLKENFILASFIPLILYMSGAVGNQTEILLIRNMTIDNKISIGRYFFRELRTSLFIALILASLLFLVSLIFFNAPYYISIILSSSLFIAIFVSVLVGVFMPYSLKAIGKDPAIGSGPFSTIVRDVLSLIIYFIIATSLLSLF